MVSSSLPTVLFSLAEAAFDPRRPRFGMESHGSVPPASAQSRFLGPGWDDYGFLSGHRLQELEQAKWQFVHYERKSLLEKVLHGLEAPSPAVFSQVDCGDSVMKVSIKLDLAGLVNQSGVVVSSEVIEGEASLSPQTAKESAIFRALVFLDHNYFFKINDFSSRSICKLEKLISIEDLDQGIMAVENVSAQFGTVVSKCKVLVEEQRAHQCCDHFNGPFSDKGRVYGAVIDEISSLIEKVEKKSKVLREEFDDVKSHRNLFEETMKERAQKMEKEGPFSYVDFPSKEMLERVLSYYALASAEYTNSCDPYGYVISKCVFHFPYIEGFQFGGRIEIPGKSYSSVQAEEDAAFQALCFIEKYFLTKICDYNYTKRRKAIKAQKKILDMLSKTIELVDSWRYLFGKLTNVIVSKRGLFNFEPSIFFHGATSSGQIEAYYILRNGLSAVEKCSAVCFDACGSNFEAVQKLSWKFIAAEAELPDVA